MVGTSSSTVMGRVGGWAEALLAAAPAVRGGNGGEIGSRRTPSSRSGLPSTRSQTVSSLGHAAASVASTSGCASPSAWSPSSAGSRRWLLAEAPPRGGGLRRRHEGEGAAERGTGGLRAPPATVSRQYNSVGARMMPPQRRTMRTSAAASLRLRLHVAVGDFGPQTELRMVVRRPSRDPSSFTARAMGDPSVEGDVAISRPLISTDARGGGGGDRQGADRLLRQALAEEDAGLTRGWHLNDPVGPNTTLAEAIARVCTGRTRTRPMDEKQARSVLEAILNQHYSHV
ncbi:hypothetical protein CBR_g37589 [Chara braunii]|uniref:Uncharacterized protein n=1 Tax=Chara braunii TaxID=69332 RepID=A0A388LNE2_CHABU|nr:hypothetical protein CBR_g37589 [Chara braunii]|eukprot:GBG83789.1 hypothetical protein CBR_g37589 [Chara braunii]